MKEILLLSGKGGTGKTSISGCLAALCGDAVLVDCDVDASNLHLILHCERGADNEFFGSKEARIDPSLCTRCGKCVSLCRYGAIGGFVVDPLSCEGCGLCSRVCPENAVSMVDRVSGYWFQSDTPYGTLFHARLRAGEGNSGKLVSLLREKARDLAEESGKIVILDGPPGIGCPVMASLAGVSMVVIVTEPSTSGYHDFLRILRVCEVFGVRTAVVVNRFDLDEGISKRIEAECRASAIPVIGKIPVDHKMVKALVKGMPAVEYAAGPAVQEIRVIWRKIQEALAS